MKFNLLRLMSILVLLIIFKFGDSNNKIKSPFITDAVLYQGWGFFTTNPMYSNLYHYKIINKKLIFIPLNTSSINSLFGIKRNVKREVEAFNYIYKNPVNWRITNYKTENEILQDISKREKISIIKSRSKLAKAIYLTKKIETIEIDKLNNSSPRQAFYIFEVI